MSADLETYTRVFCTPTQDGAGLWWLQHSTPLCGSSHTGRQVQVGRRHWSLGCELDSAFIRTLQALCCSRDCPAQEWGAATQDLRGEGAHRMDQEQRSRWGAHQRRWIVASSCGLCAGTWAEITSNTDHSWTAQKEEKLSWLFLGFVQLPGEILPYPTSKPVRSQFMTFWVLFPGWP